MLCGKTWETNRELAFAIRIRGNIALRQGDYELAQRAFADTLAITRKLSDKVAVARALLELGQATLCLDDRIQAKTYIQESFDMFRELDNKSWQVHLSLLFWASRAV